MTLAEWDDRMLVLVNLQRAAAEIQREIQKVEARIEKEAGLECVHRDPGFACWQIEGAPGFFHTPREALMARDARSPNAIISP